MTSSMWLRSLVGVGSFFAAAALSAGAGTASADSMYTPLVNTKCSYQQVMAALQAQAPDIAGLVNSYPEAQTGLQQFLALPVDQRQQRIQQLSADPRWQAFMGTPQGQQGAREVAQVANTCQNY